MEHFFREGSAFLELEAFKATSLSWLWTFFLFCRCSSMYSNSKSLAIKLVLGVSTVARRPRDSLKFAYFVGSVIQTFETTWWVIGEVGHHIFTLVESILIVTVNQYKKMFSSILFVLRCESGPHLV
jgi:hypothetical protein